jgi:hypothetical protein
MSNQDIMESIYGNLPKDYCLYFYVLSMFGFILMIFTFIVALIVGIMKKKDFSFYFQALMGVLAYGLFYFQNRLLHSMCMNSLR